MLPDGQIVPLTDAQAKPELKGEVDLLKSAKPMLVATPRRATLAPGKGQTIRLRASPSVAGPAGSAPPAGEYRTHLTITTIPPRDTGLTAEQAATLNPQELRFQINSVFGISIPVIVRIGAPDVRGAIENAKLSTQNHSADGVAPPKPTAMLSIELVRQGPNSLFGNVEVRGNKGQTRWASHAASASIPRSAAGSCRFRSNGFLPPVNNLRSISTTTIQPRVI